MAVRLSTLAARKGPLTDKEIKQAEQWVADDWESHDLDGDAVKLIKRLLETVKQKRT